MTVINTNRRATAMPDSDGAEINTLDQLQARGWVLNAALGGSNATQVSISAFNALVNGNLLVIAASGGTAITMTGTLATGTTGCAVWTVSEGGSLFGYLVTGASVGVAAMPTITASQLPIALTIIACTAGTGFTLGTNSLADSSYTVTHMGMTGPTAIAMKTEKITYVPG